MAITNYKRQEELAKQTQQVGSGTPYTGMQGVSQNTANNLGNYQQGYQQSDRVTQAQNTLQQVQNNRPQSYASKYSGALENILQQIQNPGTFKYEFNGDNLFKGYADYYNQMGKQASLNAQGQAAALTGGYGNSYGQAAGQQQYQQYMLGLYDKGMDLYDRAYQRYKDQLGNNMDMYNILQSADAEDYNRYRDTVSDWQREEELAANRALTYEQMDREAYQNDLDYWTGLARIENADYISEQERQEAIRQYEQNYAEEVRQFNEKMAEQQRSTDLDEAYRRDTLAEQIRQNDLDEAYRYKTLAEQQRQADLDEAYRRDTFGWQQQTDARDYEESVRQNDQKLAYNYVTSILANGQMPSDALLQAAGLSKEDAMLLMAQIQASGGGKSGSKKSELYYLGGENYGYFDNDGKFVRIDPSKMPEGTTYEQDYNKTTNSISAAFSQIPSVAQNVMSGIAQNVTPSEQTRLLQKAASLERQAEVEDQNGRGNDGDKLRAQAEEYRRKAKAIK